MTKSWTISLGARRLTVSGYLGQFTPLIEWAQGNSVSGHAATKTRQPTEICTLPSSGPSSQKHFTKACHGASQSPISQGNDINMTPLLCSPQAVWQTASMLFPAGSSTNAA